jgi:hypothetical protein
MSSLSWQAEELQRKGDKRMANQHRFQLLTEIMIAGVADRTSWQNWAPGLNAFWQHMGKASSVVGMGIAVEAGGN